jgi:vacuolar protein sorting-associated protein 54
MCEMTPAAEQWSLYSAAQNLPAVLNDPNRGKQSNFFIKTWGDTFVEKSQIEKSPFLPEITYSHFDNYIRKIGKRYKRHIRLTQNKLDTNHVKARNKADLVNGEISVESIPDFFFKAKLSS